jgi:DNA-binding transcriptional LysR family regulator
MDVAIVPSDHVPVRFSKRVLYEEEFVLAMRVGHPYAANPSLARYCQAQHLVVSVGRVPEVWKPYLAKAS